MLLHATRIVLLPESASVHSQCEYMCFLLLQALCTPIPGIALCLTLPQYTANASMCCLLLQALCTPIPGILIWQTSTARSSTLSVCVCVCFHLLQALCTRIPGIANVAHIDSSELPLASAARLNHAAAARALIELGGAKLEDKDTAMGRTALKVGEGGLV
jgi:hypothetical protein